MRLIRVPCQQRLNMGKPVLSYLYVLKVTAIARVYVANYCAPGARLKDQGLKRKPEVNLSDRTDWLVESSWFG